MKSEIIVECLNNSNANLMLKVEGEEKLSTKAYIGRNGTTDNKVEGDGKTPIGTFKLGKIFGLADKEKLKAELKNQGKPEAIWDKIIPGQIDRFIADNTLIDQRLTLMGQFFVMDDKKTIAQVLEQKSKELGDNIVITEYMRFELGEGIEKKVEDFASEVMAQMQ